MNGNDRSRMETYFDRLWPICRSLAGPGYRDSLAILSELVPFEKHAFKTGEAVFDWTVPKEWIPRDAYIIGPNGNRYGEFKKNNLHLLGYSVPFKGTLSLAELKPHLYSLPEVPTAIPYLTSYYKERWGFCLSHDELISLPDGDYQVLVDAEQVDGQVVVGEAILPGESSEEILFTSYLCHPSLANNELSGPLVLSFLYDKIAAMPKRKYTYRFVIAPETIGSLCYLKLRGETLKKNLKAGFLLTCIGRRDPLSFKRSRRGQTAAERAARLVLKDFSNDFEFGFDPADGSDDRQYCSPGFDLPYITLMRGPQINYPEYHTSLDNKDFISFDSLQEAVQAALKMAQALEGNAFYQNTVMYGEPQLGKRGLYNTLGSQRSIEDKVRMIMWVLSLADGTRDLFAIAEASNLPIDGLIQIADELKTAGLLKSV